jgi:hypothetical protein
MMFKRAQEYKYYLYISASKTKMLYEQLPKTVDKKKNFEWGLKLGVASMKRSTTTEKTPDRDEMLNRVVEALGTADQLGTLEQPKDFIRDTFPVRWGFYNDCRTRPVDEPALVYFGGFEDGLLLGMGGSSCHVLGHEGATSTWSRSSTPTLTRWLLSGLEGGRPTSAQWCEVGDLPSMRDEEDEVFRAMTVAQHYLRPPTQTVEFVAKTLAVGEVIGMEPFIGVKKARAILATPLYVALLKPPNDNPTWGLSEDDWLLDGDRK